MACRHRRCAAAVATGSGRWWKEGIFTEQRFLGPIRPRCCPHGRAMVRADSSRHRKQNGQHRHQLLRHRRHPAPRRPLLRRAPGRSRALRGAARRASSATCSPPARWASPPSWSAPPPACAKQGVAVVVLDLTAIGQNLTAEQWYDGLLRRVGSVDPSDLEERAGRLLARRTSALGPAAAVDGGAAAGGAADGSVSVISDQVLRAADLALRTLNTHHASRLVIFIDEIDAVRSLPFSTDEFFAGDPRVLQPARPGPGVRAADLLPAGRGHALGPDPGHADDALQHRPAHRADRLHRAGSGAAGPGACRPRDRADVRIAEEAAVAAHPLLDRRASLSDAAVVPGRRRQSRVATPARQVPISRSVTLPATRDRRGGSPAVQALFLSAAARGADDNLLFVRERLLKSEAELASLLDVYARVRVAGG